MAIPVLRELAQVTADSSGECGGKIDLDQVSKVGLRRFDYFSAVNEKGPWGPFDDYRLVVMEQ